MSQKWTHNLVKPFENSKASLQQRNPTPEWLKWKELHWLIREVLNKQIIVISLNYISLLSIKRHFNLNADYLLILQNQKASHSIDSLSTLLSLRRNETSTQMMWSPETRSIFINISLLYPYVKHYGCSFPVHNSNHKPFKLSRNNRLKLTWITLVHQHCHTSHQEYEHNGCGDPKRRRRFCHCSELWSLDAGTIANELSFVGR